MSGDAVGRPDGVAGGGEAGPSAAAGTPRRRLLDWMARGVLSLWALGGAWVLVSFLKPLKRRLGDRVIEVGRSGDLAPGRGRLVRFGREPIWVVRTPQGALVAVSAVCTHLRCVLDWDERRGVLACPCHEGSFDSSGNVLGGPPPAPLARYRVEESLGRIYVRV